MLIHDKFYCEGNNNYQKFYNVTDRLSKRQNVVFALYCAKNVFHLVEEEYKENTKSCLDLVEKWLKDENSVTKEELRKAANAINAADTAGWSAANAAYYSAASYTGWAAAAHYTWNSAYYAYSAAWTAVGAWTNPNNKLNEYLVLANSYLTKTNINCPNYEVEGKILYLIDELEENIVIVHNDKYYVNMNGIEKCPEYGFPSQHELLQKLLYSEDRFWVFARNWLDNLYKNQ